MPDVAKLLDPVTRIRQRRTAPLVLELDLTEGVTDEVPADPIGRILTKRRQRLTDLVEGIRRGALDPRVKALIARVDGRPLGFAQVQELRNAVRAFRGAGKPAVAWSESFGELAPGTVPYYLAAAFDEIALLPTGTVGLTGLSIRSTFVRDAIDKLGVQYEGGARHEYKNAVNMFTEREFTEPHREATGRIVESLSDQVVEGVAAGRGMTPERVRELVGRGPFLASEAQAHGLVDRLAYRDEVIDDLLGRFAPEGAADPQGTGADGDGRPTLQFVTRYQHRQAMAERVPAVRRDEFIALIHASGTVETGRSRRSPLGGGTSMGSDTIAAAFRAARRNPQVRAVVFRVDSRGGSPVASDVIRREAELTSESGTPVIATMGDVAGSGGYYVALGADAIVAHPGTLTGSIGVFVGKPVLKGLMDRVGISTDAIDGGEHSGMFTPDRPFTESEWERVNTLLDAIYDDFTAKVAEARGLSRDQVHEVARGRVWTGQDAHERGLVDELGGLDAAVRLARAKAGLPSTAPLRLFPQPGPLDRFLPAESSEDKSEADVRVSMWGPLARLTERLGLPAAGPLVMPGEWEIR
ncbi:protease-4 [Nocardiopsis mwathae]|uniref:Protease-4 n=1 Tax=Nocardiopsis mwathae TaxID=1472723 RepID=A0A7W9YFA1_9ACTN|nr:signal peptide peptidase SppA [Nocardiopsis mwathae]MBB6170386.1 protease-4 [Nocardiopsis mwathae]